VFIFEWGSHKIALAPVDQSGKLEKPQAGSSNFLGISKNGHSAGINGSLTACIYRRIVKILEGHLKILVGNSKFTNGHLKIHRWNN